VINEPTGPPFAGLFDKMRVGSFLTVRAPIRGVSPEGLRTLALASELRLVALRLPLPNLSDRRYRCPCPGHGLASFGHDDAGFHLKSSTGFDQLAAIVYRIEPRRHCEDTLVLVVTKPRRRSQTVAMMRREEPLRREEKMLGDTVVLSGGVILLIVVIVIVILLMRRR
jgi:hypothetical protein